MSHVIYFLCYILKYYRHLLHHLSIQLHSLLNTLAYVFAKMYTAIYIKYIYLLDDSIRHKHCLRTWKIKWKLFHTYKCMWKDFSSIKLILQVPPSPKYLCEILNKETIVWVAYLFIYSFFGERWVETSDTCTKEAEDCDLYL